MVELIVFIVSIIVLSNCYDWYKKSTMPKKIFQLAKKNSEELNRIFLKSFIPCIYDMRALSEAYEKGLKKLNDVQANKFFSYPKTYVIDKNDNLIVNDVNLGPAKECSLLQFGWDLGYGYTTTYEPRYSLIKEHFNGCMIVDEYKYDYSFVEFGKNIEREKETDRLVASYKEEKKEFLKDKDNIIGVSESAFKKFGHVLPEKYKSLYNDFQVNNYTREEMKDKLKSLYDESIKEYDMVESSKNSDYMKAKTEQAKSNKERVGKFWNSAGPFGISDLNRDLNKEVSDEEWRKDFKENSKFTGSGFRSLSLLKKYGGEEKRIVEEYSLE